jgi:sugar/nucleoside kinase (ribokinase family)
MSVLIVGTTALDSIKTPHRENPRLLGGSASHAAVAASFFAPVRLVGVVGSDFPAAYWRLYERHGIDLQGLQRAEGKTFHWSGEYMADMNQRRTLKTELGVLEQFAPTLPRAYRDSPYVLLANIAPALQLQVLAQMRRPRFVVADTMDLWLNIALPDLLKLLKRVDALVLNESEAQQLTKTDNLRLAAERIHRLGPAWVIIKKGSHGAMLSGPDGFFLAPAYPLRKVVDPTGAGDSFVGGLTGYLASSEGGIKRNLRRAVMVGTVVASFCCEGFGLQRTDRLKLSEIEQRLAELEQMCRF